MQSISKVIEKLKGRPATDEEVKRVYSIASAVGVPDNDIFLSLIVALDHYWGIYAGIPQKIDQATEKAAASAAATAKVEIAKLAASQQEKLADAVYRASEKAASAASVKAMVRWIVGGTLASAVIVCALALGMYKVGKKSGIEIGIAQATNQELILKKRDSFAKSELGDLARKFDQVGILEKILSCTNPGWEIRDGICYPRLAVDKETKEQYAYGWKIPD